MSDILDKPDATAARGRGSRRSWSRAEKRRIIEEAFRPGASVADVARSYGLNANQVFNWRRRAIAAATAKAKSSSSAALVPQGEMVSTPGTAAFLPIGVVVPTDAPGALPPAAPESGAVVPDGPGSAHPAIGGRAGLIEIDLACGTRLLVDAFVNERALRRVLSVLKAAS